MSPLPHNYYIIQIIQIGKSKQATIYFDLRLKIAIWFALIWICFDLDLIVCFVRNTDLEGEMEVHRGLLTHAIHDRICWYLFVREYVDAVVGAE